MSELIWLILMGAGPLATEGEKGIWGLCSVKLKEQQSYFEQLLKKKKKKNGTTRWRYLVAFSQEIGLCPQ